MTWIAIVATATVGAFTYLRAPQAHETGPAGAHGKAARPTPSRSAGGARPSPYWRLERRYWDLHKQAGRLGAEIRRLRAEKRGLRRAVTVLRVKVGARATQARREAARHADPVGSSSLERAFLCIYAGENGGYGWSVNTGNGYYGGLQMDREFQSTYGSEFVRAWGTADNWPRSVQIAVAIRAYLMGRGFRPWPNTARACGLL